MSRVIVCSFAKNCAALVVVEMSELTPAVEPGTGGGGGSGNAKPVPGKKRRASTISRIFGHLMDVGGGFAAGTWIVGMLFLDSCPEDDKLKGMVKEKLLSMPRFRSKLVLNRSAPYFEEVSDEEFDWDYHLSKQFENETADMDKVMEFVGGFYEMDISLEKPLWKMVLIPKMDDGRACLVTILNHGIADGVASVGVLLKMLDDAPMDPTRSPKEQAGIVPGKRKNKPKVSLASRIGMFAAGVQEGLFGPFGKVDGTSILKPTKSTNWVGTKKVLAMGDQIPLDKVKEIKNKFEGATVNDILITLLTITLKEYFKEEGDPIAMKNSPIRGNFPVNTRGPNQPILKDGDPNNEWSAVSFRFPFNYADPVDCVFKVKSKLDKLKVSPQTIVAQKNADLLIKTLPRKFLLDKVVQLNAKTTAMLSNVPGPQEKVHLAGKGLDDLMFFLFSPLNVYLGIITYNGKVSVGINFGAELKQDPAKLAKHWKSAYSMLYEDAMAYEGTIHRKASLRKKAPTEV